MGLLLAGAAVQMKVGARGARRRSFGAETEVDGAAVDCYTVSANSIEVLSKTLVKLVKF